MAGITTPSHVLIERSTAITRITSKMGRNAKIISNSFGIVPLSVVDVAEMDFLSNTLSYNRSRHACHLEILRQLGVN